MPAKPVFTPEEREVIFEAARRVWKGKFEWMKKRTKDHPPGQEAMALALGISQQSVSALLLGKYNPGIKVARNIANLDGHTLEQLLPDWGKDDEPESRAHLVGVSTFANLDVCLKFYATTKHWSAWTIAAAQSGFFGNTDLEAPEWASKLDHLEKVLERARKTP